MLPLLILRPEPGASATFQRAIALGLDARLMPLFAIEPVAWQPPDPNDFDALLISSANAVRSAGPGLNGLAALPAHAVGATSADAVSEAGLDLVATGNADAQAMVDAMTAAGFRRILWLTGAERTELQGGAARITPVVTYAAKAIAAPPEWAAAIAGPAVIMLHSARAARLASKRVGPARKHLIALAISQKVASAAGPGWGHCAIAAHPSDGEMLALALQLCQMKLG